MHKRSHVYQLWSHSYTHYIKITSLHALRRSRNNSIINAIVKIMLEGYGRYYQKWILCYNGYIPRRNKILPR